MSLFGILLAAIPLLGVTGEKLRTRAFFDANNVKVGDPMVLTLDFLGEADFAALHPPALSRQVSQEDWKLDDQSAKTATYRDARRLTYRVRPLREGVLWFPALEFSYTGKDGATRTVRSNEIPVHAKPGTDVVVAGMDQVRDETKMPDPPSLVEEPGVALGADDDFAWRKACAEPTADAFAAFDFPAAKLNEAACALRDGDWKRALKVYGRLEWTTGQTEEIEEGLVAALARRYDNPLAELPVWRQVGRPVLKYGWKGRVGLVGGSLLAVVLVFWLLGKAIRALVCVGAALLLAWPAAAQFGGDPFAEMERMHQQMEQRMQQMMSGGGMSFSFGGRREAPPEIRVTAQASKAKPQVGERFAFVLSIETPKNCTLDQLGVGISQTYGLKTLGRIEPLDDARSANPSNVVRRLSLSVRYDVPFRGEVAFTVGGMATVSRGGGRRGGFGSFTFSQSFQAKSAPVAVEVRPLPSAGQPKDFSGIVADNLTLVEKTDLRRVETNDVVRITYTLRHDGYLPDDWAPPGAAFEIGRDGETDEWRRFFVADGAPATPRFEVVYYAPTAKKYRRLPVGGTKLSYKPSK